MLTYNNNKVKKNTVQGKEKKTKYISIADLAKTLGISRIAVFRKIKKGQIKALKIGRSYAISTEEVSGVIRGAKLKIKR